MLLIVKFQLCRNKSNLCGIILHHTSVLGTGQGNVLLQAKGLSCVMKRSQPRLQRVKQRALKAWWTRHAVIWVSSLLHAVKGHLSTQFCPQHPELQLIFTFWRVRAEEIGEIRNGESAIGWVTFPASLCPFTRREMFEKKENKWVHVTCLWLLNLRHETSPKGQS